MDAKTESIFNTLVLHEKISRNKVKNLKAIKCDVVPLDEKKKLDKYIKQFVSESDGYRVEYQFPELKNYGRVKQTPYTGLGTFCREVRGYLANGVYLDIDAINCHPVILLYQFEKDGLNTSVISEYVNDRESFLKNEGFTKEEFLKMINNESYPATGKVKQLHDQIYGAFLAKIMNDHPEIKAKKSFNRKGQVIANYLQDIEFHMLSEIYKYGQANGLLIDVLMHDGFFVRITDSVNEKVINEKHISKFTELMVEKFGINMKFKIKEHDNSLEAKVEEENNGKVMNNYEEVKTEFEKDHFKLCEDALFVKEKDDDILFFSAKKIADSCEHMVYKETDFAGKSHDVTFIHKWKKDPSIRKYDTFKCYPNDDFCPNNVYNTWRKFEMEKVASYTEKKEELQEVLNHINVLCGNEEPVFDYFIKWIAQMIQFPETKSICVTLISNQGAGKGTLIKLFKKMLGEKKVLESTNPTRDVWGGFNGQMASAFLVNLNELSKKDTFDSEGKIKGLITDSELIINNKGLNAYSTDSYHRFIITTNNYEPLNTSKDDRRNLIIRSSDEKCGNSEYFDHLYKILEDQDVIKTCYEYFKSIKGMDKFKNLKTPIVEHQLILQQASVSPIELWVRHIVTSATGPTVELLSSEAYGSFREFLETNGFKHEVTSMQFFVKLSLMKIDGVEEGPRKKGLRTRLFDVSKIIKYLKMEELEWAGGATD